MADDFVNNFGLLGQVLFKKRNEREARQKLDEALSRELAKIAAQAGYEKEIAEMGNRAAMDREKVGESGAKDRQLAELALREKLAQDAIQARVDEQGRDFLTRLGEIKTTYGAKGDLEDQAWKREEANRRKAQEIAERNSYAQYLQSLALYGRDNDIAPELLTLGNIPAGKTNVPVGTKLSPDGSARRGRFSVSKPDGTPPKPGETPRSPDNAAPEVPVQVGPRPLNSGVSIIGGDKATLQGGPEVAQPSFMELMQQAPQYDRPQRSLLDTPNVGPADSVGAGLLDSIRGNTWGVGPGTKNIEALLEAYLQKSSPAIKK